MPSESELTDLVAAALRGDDQWDSLSESQKSVWRADADRAIKAMRSAARTGPDVAGFEALTSCEVVAAVQKAIMAHPHFEGGSCTAFGFANTAMKAAIAALPPPAGESVTVEELAQAARDADFNDGQCLGTDSSESYERMATTLLSTFTITRKSEAGS